MCFGLNAQARLSPAMEIIAERIEISRCVASGSQYQFTQNDFDEMTLGCADTVEITLLPSRECGALNLAGLAACEGQLFNRERFSKLCFSPSDGFEGKAEIQFDCGGIKTVMCLNVTKTQNRSPESADISMETAKNVAVFKSALAADPDGDDISLRIVKYPSHGSVRISSDGQLVYRPLSEYTGNDSFEYSVVDEYGNSSGVSTANIKVSKPAADIYFHDMRNHWAHNSAIKMASTGLMTGENVDGRLLFNPEKDMTRGDFLALSLIMTGHEKDIPFVSKTVFADDGTIPANIKSYVQYAYDKGIVSGYENADSSINFESAGAVTKAEAAVMINKILNLESDTDALPSYKDAHSVPAWADSAVSTLSSLGIISGNSDGYFCAGKRMTRAEGAEMICKVADYLEKANKKTKSKEKSVSNLFGLLG